MKKLSITLMMLMITVVMLVAGCSKSDKFAPVPINEGVDVCEVCNMMVTDDQHATQLILNSGRSLKFDDIGDLFVWKTNNGLDDVNVQYVRDFHTLEWIELDTAHFAYDASFKTPMGYGVLSFKDKKEAEAYVADHQVGTLLSAKQLESHSWESSMSHGDHDHHDHGTHDDHGHGEHGAHGEGH